MPHDAIIELLDGSTFPIHKILLAAYSELLKNMFQYDQQDGKIFKITSEHVTKAAMQALIDLVYEGDMKLTIPNCLEILKGADFLISDIMVKKCETFVLTQPEAFKDQDFEWIFQELKEKVDDALKVEEDERMTTVDKVDCHLI